MAKINLKAIAEQLHPSWIPIRTDEYLPARDGMYEIFTTEGEFVPAWFNSRKSLFTSEDGGDGYDALAWRTLKK